MLIIMAKTPKKKRCLRMPLENIKKPNEQKIILNKIIWRKKKISQECSFHENIKKLNEQVSINLICSPTNICPK